MTELESFDTLFALITMISNPALFLSFQTFQLIASENLQEALQVIEKSKAGIFVGTKTGKIFKLNPDVSMNTIDGNFIKAFLDNPLKTLFF